MINNLEDGTITFCDHDTFTDLCQWGHIPNTGFVKPLRFWVLRGLLSRRTKTTSNLPESTELAFLSKKDLTEYLELLEEAKKETTASLGRNWTFTFSQRVGQGLPLWLPKELRLGTFGSFLKAAQKSGYEMVVSPHIAKNKRTLCDFGHFAKYGEDSFRVIKTPNEGEEFMLKPWTAPHHCEMYNSRPWSSYKGTAKTLPNSERYIATNRAGELHGLTRVRGFTQDDAHIFFVLRISWMPNSRMWSILVLYVFGSLGFENFRHTGFVRDPEKPEKYIGSLENWEKPNVPSLMLQRKRDWVIVSRVKQRFMAQNWIFMVKDALGRSWQLGTIQVDYNLPERFGLTYKGATTSCTVQWWSTAPLFGSMERFIAILLEHTGETSRFGWFPNRLASCPWVRNMKIRWKSLKICFKITKFAPRWRPQRNDRQEN